MNNNKRRTPLLRGRRAHRRERWDAPLTGIIDISRILGSNLDIESIWDALHDHISLSFDTTSFFVALHDYERNQLALPLVSENGLSIEHEPIPVCGMSRAVIQHGVELYIQDTEAEAERLHALGIEPDEREPGCWARAWIGVPLRSRQNEVIGVIALQNMAPNSFSDQAFTLLMALAGSVALALDNLRLIETERERRLIAGALMDIGQLAGKQLDYDDVLDHILEQLQRVVSYDSAAALLPPSGEQRTLIISTSHDPDAFVKGAILRYADLSPVAQSMFSQQPVVVADTANSAGWWEGDAPRDGHLRSWLIVPMIVQQEVGGLLLLGKLAPSGYTQKDASSAFALARQGAITLETARLQAQAQANAQVFQHRSRRLTAINRIVSVITSSLERAEIFRTTAQLLAELFEADHCGIVMIEPSAEDAVLEAEYPDTGCAGLRIPTSGNATLDWLTRYGTAVTIEDVANTGVDDATCAALRQMGVQSTLIAPLIIRDHLIGTISIDMLNVQRPFTSEERETLVLIAGQTAIAVSHATLYEEALTLSRLRSAFLANISHELRTPLNSIIGYSDMLLGEFYGALNEQQRDRMMRVNLSGKHLLHIIDDVLSLSRLEAGQVTLSRLPLHVSDVVNEVVSAITPEAQAKSLSLEVTIAPDEPLVRADAPYLRPVIANLLSNAVKFTRTGGVKVEVLPTVSDGSRCAPVAAPEQLYVPQGDWVALRVTDTGIGIKPEDHEVIFESFRQADNSAVREYGGTGLGLAITRRLVELHEGYIWVESALDMGSTFTVLLPAAVPDLIAEADQAATEHPPE